MLINTANSTPNTGFRDPTAIITRTAKIVVLWVTIEFLSHVCFADSAEVAVFRIAGFGAADLFCFDKAGDMFELAAFRTTDTGHSRMVVLPLANADDGAFRVPLRAAC